MTRDPIDITQAVFGPGYDGIRTLNEVNRLRDQRAERFANRAVVGLCAAIATVLILAARSAVIG